MDAQDIVRQIREQNWKNGGSLVMDVEEAVALVQRAIDQAADRGYALGQERAWQSQVLAPLPER